jgi:uncharacterized protein (DUF2235 family)
MLRREILALPPDGRLLFLTRFIRLFSYKGDEIFIFGFSRGAYTARSLAAMIAISGLPLKKFSNIVVDTAFEAYRNRDARNSLLVRLGEYSMDDAKIKMLGVWETVGVLGIPALVGEVSTLLYGFLDTALHPDILNGYHAVGIDERRAEFPPCLWTSAPAPGQVIEQVWFTGVHSDVGGGYPERELSEITLGWMLDKAVRLGIEIDSRAASRYKTIDPMNSIGVRHESWNPLCGPVLFQQTRPLPTVWRFGSRGSQTTVQEISASIPLADLVAIPSPKL